MAVPWTDFLERLYMSALTIFQIGNGVHFVYIAYIECMPLFPSNEANAAAAIAGLAYVNPFLPERIELEQRILKRQGAQRVWSRVLVGSEAAERLDTLAAKAESAVDHARARLRDGQAASDVEASLYEDCVWYLLYYRFQEQIVQAKSDMSEIEQQVRSQIAFYFDLPGIMNRHRPDAVHVMACIYQIRRAFASIHTTILGESLAAARLRANIWQSVFTHDLRRYVRLLFDKTADFTTLITGPSGTGKELVARAIACSRYIAYDAGKHRFAVEGGEIFLPLNLSAISSSLLESELFGHARGAFTGATADRLGYLETCPPLGTVFLDEIGELEGGVQVKLLRVLQTREFQRIGDTKTRPFTGKVIAATNRDLPAEMAAGRFRADFYYRLCSDTITTPSLAEQLAEDPAELERLVGFIVHRLIGESTREVIAEVMAAAERLGRAYAWPGNFRELEQCVRNVLVRGDYQPAAMPTVPSDDVSEQLRRGTMTADQLLTAYCRHVHGMTGSYVETAKRLGLDRRTVAARVGD